MGSKIIKGAAVFLLLAFLLLPIIFGYDDEEYSSKSKEMSYHFEDVILTGHDEGLKQWKLVVNDLIDKGNDRTILEDLDHGEIYDEDGVVQYLLVADRGEYFRKTDIFTLRDNIIVTSNDGETMKTDILQYNENGKILTTGIVEITTKDMKLNAAALRLDVDKEIYDFSGGVTLEFEIDDTGDEQAQDESGGVEE